MPHGWCLNWNARIIVPSVLSDGIIALAYIGISLALIYTIRKHETPPLSTKILFWFSTFMMTCAFTHIADIIVIWWPVYWVSTGLRIACALTSLITSLTLWPVVLFLLRLSDVKADA